jgi:hypothetical protein
MSARALAVLVLVVGLAGTARGDVVDPPPRSCPHGGMPTTSHGGPYCAATTCEPSGEPCPRGSSCREASICVATSECGGQDSYSCSGVVASCAYGAGCPRGTTCQRLRTCAPTVWGRAGGTLALGGVVLVAGALVLLRRRSR